MRHDFELEFKSPTNYTYIFLSFCEDFEVAQEALKTRHLILIIKYRDYNLLLSQFFLNLVKFNQEYKPNSIFCIITYDETPQLAVFQTLTT